MADYWHNIHKQVSMKTMWCNGKLVRKSPKMGMNWGHWHCLLNIISRILWWGEPFSLPFWTPQGEKVILQVYSSVKKHPVIPASILYNIYVMLLYPVCETIGTLEQVWGNIQYNAQKLFQYWSSSVVCDRVKVNQTSKTNVNSHCLCF